MYCGTSNIVLPVRNKTEYPDAFRERSRLEFYSSLFNSLEVNSTFYKMPRAATVVNWAVQSPTHFRFSIKLSKTITHQKLMEFDPADVARFMSVMQEFGDRKGCLLIQFPAGTKAIACNRLELLLELISLQNDGWKLAVEFRDPSWYNDHVFTMLEQYDCCIVEHDMPKSAPPPELPASDTRFLRFHGPLGDYRGSYTDNFLFEIARLIVMAERSGPTVYAYFNNTMGRAVHNALTLQAMYEESARYAAQVLL